MTTAHADLIEFSNEIVSQMSAPDLADFDPARWREGIGAMEWDGWGEYDVDDVLAAVEAAVKRSRS